VLAGFELLAPGQGPADALAAVVGWLDTDGRWFEDGPLVSRRLIEAARSAQCEPASAAELQRALDQLVGPIRERLALVGSRRWAAAEPEPSARRLASRLVAAVRQAARRRDRSSLARLERALAFTAGGHTAGEARLVRRLAEADAREVAGWLHRVPAPTPRWDAVEVRLTGLVVFTGQGPAPEGTRPR
jgi:hypothetical protein